MLAGLAAGILTTAVMTVGRKTGVLGKTLDRDAVDWIDAISGSRAVIGDAETSAVEFGNNLAASAALAAAWPTLRRLAPDMPVALLAAGYGTAIYAVKSGGIAPVLGITDGEDEAGLRKATERWMVHIIQAVPSGVLAEQLTDRETTLDAVDLRGV